MMVGQTSPAPLDRGAVGSLMETLRLFLTDAGCRQRLGEANRKASERFLSWEESSFALARLLRRISPQTE